MESKVFEKSVGSRLDVWEGRAKWTSGKLTKDQLFIDEHNVIRSKKQAESMKKKVPESEHVAPIVEESDEDGGAKAVPIDKFTVKDLRDAISRSFKEKDKIAPKGYNKMNKAQLIELAASEGIIG